MDYFKNNVEDYVERNYPDLVDSFSIVESNGVYDIRFGSFSIDYIPGKSKESQIYIWGVENSGSDFMEIDSQELDNFLRLRSRLPNLEDISCKHGFSDCVYDPLYIKHHDLTWFKELYPDGDITNACEDCENGECYDDEDK